MKKNDLGLDISLDVNGFLDAIKSIGTASDKSTLESWGNFSSSIAEAMEAANSVLEKISKDFDLPAALDVHLIRYGDLRNLPIEVIIEKIRNAYISVDGEYVLTDIHEELRMTKENSKKNNWTKDLDEQVKKILSEDLIYLSNLDRDDCAIFKDMSPLTFCKFLIGEVWGLQLS